MQSLSEDVVAELLEEGNGASRVIPSDGGGFVKVSYLWGKLRIDRTDEDGKILLPARRVVGGDIPTTPTD